MERPFVEVKHGDYILRFWRTTNGWISEVIADEFMNTLLGENNE